jgi:predicted helicase
MVTNSIHDYLHALEKELAAGSTTEHTHRPALKTLLQALNPGIIATNEPQHIIDIGAPDFRIIKNKLAIGYVECKDIGKSLDEALKTDQLKRYLHSFNNFMLTDYLEFRWYVGGKLRLRAILGTHTKGKIKQDKDGIQSVADLLTSFLNHEPEPIGSPRELAGHMARLADIMRDSTVKTLKGELATGSLHAQLLAFRENLIPELPFEQFADMYAQTIAYGLFAARCEMDNGKNFTRQQAAYLIPKTNPFLRKLFNYIAGPDLDASITWAVDDLAQILAWADMEAVLKGFGKSTGKEDPVVHFYETFLKEYDPKTREMRGVYYTPLPVVSYIVRSIDHILKTRFEKLQGLADPSVLVLDPAVGTATFLYMVMQEIHDVVIKQGQQGTWNDYVTDKLLPRLFGFELLMAPYAIAHLKLERLLKETGYQFQTDQRLQIYLTNTLGEGIAPPQQYYGLGHDLAEESKEANKIKREKQIVVVLGNPPYSGASANKGKWAKELVQRYYQVDGAPLGEKNPKWLQDDYVKFLAFGQWRIEQTKQGVLGFITNHSYLDNPTFRGMRQSLMNTFTDIYILNLHGNSKKKEVAPDGSKDENVFDIQQGVTIGIFIKEAGKTSPAIVHHADLWGKWEGKYEVLAETDVTITGWTALKPTSPYYLFVLQNDDIKPEYEHGWKVTDIFPVNGVGMTTARDHVVIDYEPQPLIEKATMFKDSEDSNAILCEKLSISQKLGWNITRARQLIQQEDNLEQYIKPVLYRPFDARFIFYHDSLVWRTVKQVMRHMLAGDNLGLISARSNKSPEMNHFFCSRFIMETKCGEATTQSCLFPLYLYPTEEKAHIDENSGKQDGTQPAMKVQEKREPNLNPDFVKEVEKKLGMKFQPHPNPSPSTERGGGTISPSPFAERESEGEVFTPEDIFNYAYAVFHSPTYRKRYAEFLKIDFPRLPLTSDKKLFKSLAEKGTQLVALHLMESPLLNTLITKYPITGSNVVEKVGYDEKTQRVNINKTQYFEGLPLEVWNFHIGGYQVCQKWLKDRKGRTLTDDDSKHCQKVIVALKETNRLMIEIDKIIPNWPIT